MLCGGLLLNLRLHRGQDLPGPQVDALWTGRIVGALPCAGWEMVISGAGLIDIELANPIDTFAGAGGESSAREFGTLGYSIRARKPA